MSPQRQALNVAKSVTLALAGGVVTGTLEIGPDDGAPFWNVTKMLVKTSRQGKAPIPSCTVYLDETTDRGSQGSTYDGSRDESDCDVDVRRGQHLIAVWIGGQAGDIATLSLTGWKES
jgi:hypothetical protein